MVMIRRKICVIKNKAMDDTDLVSVSASESFRQVSKNEVAHNGI